MLLDQAPRWTLGLLLVPIATILVAVRSVSESRLSQMRLGGLLDAATKAPDWADPGSIERALIEQAERVLRHSVAELRETPPGRGEIGQQLEVPGQGPRWLVARSAHSSAALTKNDADALAALTALAAANLSRRLLTDEMAYQAQHDALTGLPNRTLLGHRLETALAVRRQHDLGAATATWTASRRSTTASATTSVTSCSSRSPTGCGRACGLATCWPASAATSSPSSCRTTASSRPRTSPPGCSSRCRRRSWSSGNVTRIQASIGIAHGTDDVNASDLMREADMAMYRAKGLGKNRIMVFEPSLRSETLYRLELEDELRHALAAGHIQLNFQPLVDLVSGKVLGFEALARWEHESFGPVSPAVFVPLAEQLGLMSQLGSHVMDVLHDAAANFAAGQRLAAVPVGQRLPARGRRAAAAGAGPPLHRGLPEHRPGHRAHRVGAAGRRRRRRRRRSRRSPSPARGSPSTTSASATPRSAT